MSTLICRTIILEGNGAKKKKSLKNTFNLLKSAADIPSIISQVNSSVLGSSCTLLRLDRKTAARLIPLLCVKKSSSGKSHIQILLVRWILRTTKQALQYLSALILPLSYLPASKAVLILEAHLHWAKGCGVRFLS